MLSATRTTDLPNEGDVQPAFVRATPISAAGGAGLDDPSPIFFHTFQVEGEVARARLRITALGVFRAFINGERVEGDELAPGWTDYRHRLTWTEYDVISFLRPGANDIEVLVGNGWYRGRLGRPARRDLYGGELALLAELEMTRSDGATIIVSTDKNWTWRDSWVTADDLYDGCAQDLRRCSSDVALPVGSARDLPRLERATAPPIRALKRLTVEPESDRGHVSIDVRSNIVGWLEIRLGSRSSERRIRVQHAEVREGGALARRPLRDAAATDRYIVPAGADELTIAPVHTFHGFRYAEIVGVPIDEIREVVAVVVGSDLQTVGEWASSDPMLNTLHQNIQNSARGNFLSIPTDCPQRDERLGWTADAQVFAPVATYLYDVTEFLGSWLDDMQAAQTDDGSIPVVVPDVYRRESVATAGWGDACVLIPWELYAETGEQGILRRYWAMANAWIERVERAVDADGIWVDGHQYGDWLDPNAPPDRPGEAMTDSTLVATAYRVRVLEIAAQWAAAMGDGLEAEGLYDRWQRARRQFQRRFVSPRGFLTSESQAAYALAIAFELLDEDQLDVAGRRLADLVRLTDFTVGTGFLGTPVLLEALSRTGHQRVAMRVLLGRRAPSWLYAVEQGATTVWERWDSMLAGGTVNPGEMTSFNHFAFGAVAHWLYTDVAGLRRTSPGWETAEVVAPVWSDLSFASTSHRGPTGLWRVSWNRTGADIVELEVEVPEGSTAVLRDEKGAAESVGSGRHHRSYTRPSAEPRAVTLRGVMDDEARWDRVISAVQEFRPQWSRRDVAREVMPYLNRPLPDFSRVVGLSIPTDEETRLRQKLASIIF